jgi:hypothetical protein
VGFQNWAQGSAQAKSIFLAARYERASNARWGQKSASSRSPPNNAAALSDPADDYLWVYCRAAKHEPVRGGSCSLTDFTKSARPDALLMAAPLETRSC